MFGDPNMPVRKNNPKARASFRARHKCSTAKDKTTARYWACKDWQGQMKIKGIDMSSLTKRQQDTMKKHSQHHTKRHMQYMLNSMKRGATFTQAHKNAQKKVGK